VSTIASPPRPTAAPTSPVPPSQTRGAAVIMGEQRIAIRNVSWDLYDLLSDAIGEGQHVHVAFDGKDIEIMTTGIVHDDFKEMLGWFVRILTSELRIRSRGAGQTTWKRPEIARGLEADLCYFFSAEKLAVVAASRTRKSNNIADYPNPDLAVEIDITPPEVDCPGIYAALKVTEVWRFGEESLVIEHLQQDGTYAPSESSRFLPVQAKEVYRWVAVEDSNDELAWEQRLREWVRAELAPRRNP
jgi:Uma2 family endonuclease